MNKYQVSGEIGVGVFDAPHQHAKSLFFLSFGVPALPPVGHELFHDLVFLEAEDIVEEFLPPLEIPSSCCQKIGHHEVEAFRALLLGVQNFRNFVG